MFIFCVSSIKGKDGGKSGDAGVKDLGESSGRLSIPCSSASPESPNHHLYTPVLGKSEAKYLPAGLMPPLPTLPGQTLPFGFPYASPAFHSGESQHVSLSTVPVLKRQCIKSTVKPLCQSSLSQTDSVLLFQSEDW